MDLESFYYRLPIAFQNVAASFIGGRIQRRRYPPGFEDLEKRIDHQQWFAGDRLRSYQEERLRNVLRSASHSPYWKKIFQDYQLNTSFNNPFEELAKLPVLSKDVIKRNIRDFYNPTIAKQKLVSRHTSGTTGGGLVFHETPLAEQECWATWWRYRQWHGITRDTWCGYFGGRSIVPVHWNKPPFWRINRPGKQVLFSTYHLTPDTCELYLGYIRERNIRWLHGYPSMLSLFAAYLQGKNIRANGVLDIITTGAESLLPHQSETILRTFGCELRQHYGQAEGVANISECPMGNLHVDEDYSYVEFLPIDDVSNQYRLIGTNWSNHAFPLLRYDTGDLVTISTERTCPCGRPGRLVDEIDGRKEDYVLLPNGVKVGRLDHIFKDLIHVQEAQFRQNHPKRVEIWVVKGQGYDECGEESQLLLETRKRLGHDINIQIRYVNSIERTKSGKLRFVVSNLDSSTRVQYTTNAHP
jgi:phenylacetate-CoA ligase